MNPVIHTSFIFLTFFAFVVTLVFNGLAAAVVKPFFHYGPGQIENQTRSEIDAANWTFSAWGIIYLWQALWIFYTLSTVCLQGLVPGKGSLFNNPVVTSTCMLAIYILNLALNVGWLFLFDRRFFVLANVVLFLIALTLYIFLFLSTKATLKNADLFINSGRSIHLNLIVGLLQNGLGIYAGWTTVATMLNLNIVFIYRTEVGIATSGTISLTILTCCLLFYMVVDNFIFTRPLRFIYTPYIIWVWAFFGVVMNNYHSLPKFNAVFNVALLAFAIVALVTKVIVSLAYQKSDPIYVSKNVKNKRH